MLFTETSFNTIIHIEFSPQGQELGTRNGEQGIENQEWRIENWGHGTGVGDMEQELETWNMRQHMRDMEHEKHTKDMEHEATHEGHGT